MKQFKFLDQPIGLACLAKLLGVGTARLRRGMAHRPDLRFGKQKSGSRSITFSVDAFLATLYDSVAETLPDRWGMYITNYNKNCLMMSWFPYKLFK